jgi:hypothetical protein
MKAEKKKLEAQKPAGKKAAVDKKQQFTLKTVFPFNLELERDHLLASFASDEKENTDKKDAVDK